MAGMQQGGRQGRQQVRRVGREVQAKVTGRGADTGGDNLSAAARKGAHLVAGAGSALGGAGRRELSNVTGHALPAGAARAA